MKDHAKAFLIFGAMFAAWTLINQSVAIPVVGEYLPGGKAAK
jgi:hypothetical protein